MRTIFISYRRDDSADSSGRIYDRLVARYGKGAVFKDVDSIPAGVDFKEHIEGVITQCQVQLVVIGPQWLSIRDASGRRRLDDPGDYVRMEVESALSAGIPIVPLLVKQASMPVEQSLPPSLAQLVRLNALPVRYDPDFENDMRRVIAAVDQRLTAAKQRARSTPAAPPS